VEHLSREQLLAVLGEAKKASQRDWLAILVGYSHGLRISEVCALTPAHIQDGFLRIQRLKRSKLTTQPLITSYNPLLDEKTALEAWTQAYKGRQRIFGIQRSMLSKLFERYARLAKVPVHLRHFHVLKHSLAMHSISCGIENVRVYLGHASIASTGIYLKVSNQQASAAVQSTLAQH
jgi:integrase